MKLLISAIAVALIFLAVIAYGRHSTPKHEADAPAQTKNDRQEIVILLGPPGSGKGTQASNIIKQLGIVHISTGDLLRENIKQNTQLGKEAKGYMSEGKLVPDVLVLEMLKKRIAEPDSARGYLLDGFPRTIAQAEALENLIDAKARVVVIALDVSDATLVSRIEGRAKENAGNVRADDTKDVVLERLKVYHSQTKPLLQFYGNKKQLTIINGEQQPDAVYKDVKGALRK